MMTEKESNILRDMINSPFMTEIENDEDAYVLRWFLPCNFNIFIPYDIMRFCLKYYIDIQIYTAQDGDINLKTEIRFR